MVKKSKQKVHVVGMGEMGSSPVIEKVLGSGQSKSPPANKRSTGSTDTALIPRGKVKKAVDDLSIQSYSSVEAISHPSSTTDSKQRRVNVVTPRQSSWFGDFDKSFSSSTKYDSFYTEDTYDSDDSDISGFLDFARELIAERNRSYDSQSFRDFESQLAESIRSHFRDEEEDEDSMTSASSYSGYTADDAGRHDDESTSLFTGDFSYVSKVFQLRNTRPIARKKVLALPKGKKRIADDSSVMTENAWDNVEQTVEDLAFVLASENHINGLWARQLSGRKGKILNHLKHHSPNLLNALLKRTAIREALQLPDDKAGREGLEPPMKNNDSLQASPEVDINRNSQVSSEKTQRPFPQDRKSEDQGDAKPIKSLSTEESDNLRSASEVHCLTSSKADCSNISLALSVSSDPYSHSDSFSVDGRSDSPVSHERNEGSNLVHAPRLSIEDESNRNVPCHDKRRHLESSDSGGRRIEQISKYLNNRDGESQSLSNPTDISINGILMDLANISIGSANEFAISYEGEIDSIVDPRENIEDIDLDDMIDKFLTQKIDKLVRENRLKSQLHDLNQADSSHVDVRPLKTDVHEQDSLSVYVLHSSTEAEDLATASEKRCVTPEHTQTHSYSRNEMPGKHDLRPKRKDLINKIIAKRKAKIATSSEDRSAESRRNETGNDSLHICSPESDLGDSYDSSSSGDSYDIHEAQAFNFLTQRTRIDVKKEKPQRRKFNRRSLVLSHYRQRSCNERSLETLHESVDEDGSRSEASSHAEVGTERNTVSQQSGATANGLCMPPKKRMRDENQSPFLLSAPYPLKSSPDATYASLRSRKSDNSYVSSDTDHDGVSNYLSPPSSPESPIRYYNSTQSDSINSWDIQDCGCSSSVQEGSSSSRKSDYRSRCSSASIQCSSDSESSTCRLLAGSETMTCHSFSKDENSKNDYNDSFDEIVSRPCEKAKRSILEKLRITIEKVSPSEAEFCENSPSESKYAPGQLAFVDEQEGDPLFTDDDEDDALLFNNSILASEMGSMSNSLIDNGTLANTTIDNGTLMNSLIDNGTLANSISDLGALKSEASSFTEQDDDFLGDGMLSLTRFEI